MSAELEGEGANEALELTPENLSALLDVQAMQGLMDDYYALTGISIAITDLKGRMLVSAGGQEICMKFHRMVPAAQAQCRESDALLSWGVRAGDFKEYCCAHHLRDIVTPFILGGRHVGNVFMGQMLYDDEEPDQELFRAQARRFGFDEKAYLAALGRVPRVKRQKVQIAMSFCTKLVEMISALTYSNISAIGYLTNYMQVEKALRESEVKYRLLVENLNGGIWYVDPDARTTFVNTHMARMLGYTPDEMLGKHLFEFMEERDMGKARDFLGRRRGVKEQYDFELKRKDGSYVYLSFEVAPIMNKQGAFLGALAGVQDITERKQAEKALKKSEASYRLLADNVNDMITRHAPDGKYTYLTPSCRAILGYEPEELVGADPYALYHPDHIEAIQRAQASLLMHRGTELIRYPIKRKDGRYVWLETNNKIIADPETDAVLEIIAISRDITEAKRTEDELHKSEEKWRGLFNILPVGVSLLNTDCAITDINPALEEILQISKEDLKAGAYQRRQYLRRDRTSLPREEFPSFRAIKEKKAIERTEVGVVKENGDEIWTEVSAAPLAFENAGCVLVTTDITSRKRAETFWEMSREILQILNDAEPLPATIERVLSVLKLHTGWEAVGLRLQAGEDYPYFFQIGFSAEFMAAENTLRHCAQDSHRCQQAGPVKLECTCGLVISGKVVPGHPHVTPGGSFWINDSSVLLAVPAGQDPREYPRNMCARQGFASLALVPIRNNTKIVGLIQFNDHRPGRFTLETIEVLESIAAHIGSAIMRKQAEEALRENENKLNVLIETIPIPVFYKDGEGRYLGANKAFEHFHGGGREAIIGKSVFDLYAPKFAEIYSDADQKLLAGPGIQVYESCWQDAFGKVRNVIFHKAALLNSEGIVTGIVGAILDTTERRRLETEVLEISRREQERIGRDLHDVLGQELTGISLLQKVMARQLEGQNSPLAKDALKITQLVNQAIGELNQIVRGVFPAQFALAGLDTGLKKFAETVQEQYQLQCLYESSGETIEVSEIVALQLFFIVKEAVNNAIKHGRSSKIVIQLEKNAEQLILAITDNGAGFSPLPQARPGMGLNIMKYRSEIIGGDLEIGPTALGETRVTCRLPFYMAKTSA
jgi:PAS domain S-box-containing protein